MSLLCKLVPERCIACGLCQIEAPDIFDYDEEGIVLFAQEPDDDLKSRQLTWKWCLNKFLSMFK